jgi:hypothetical protein
VLLSIRARDRWKNFPEISLAARLCRLDVVESITNVVRRLIFGRA